MLVPFESSEKKEKKTVSTSRNKIFFKNIGLPLITVMVSKKKCE